MWFSVPSMVLALRLVVGDWWLEVVRGWRLVAAGGWRLVAVGGWRLVAPRGRSLKAVLRKKKIGFLKDRPAEVSLSLAVSHVSP